MDLPTREAGTPRGVSDGSSYKSGSQGLHAPLAAGLCRAAQGVAPQILPNLAWACNWELSPASSPQRSKGNCHSLHGRAGVRPLWLGGGRGTRDKVQARVLACPSRPPAPGPRTDHQHPGTPERDSAAQPQSVRASRSQFLPAHRRFTAPARRARWPSPSKARCLTVPTAVPRRP